MIFNRETWNDWKFGVAMFLGVGFTLFACGAAVMYPYSGFFGVFLLLAGAGVAGAITCFSSVWDYLPKMPEAWAPETIPAELVTLEDAKKASVVIEKYLSALKGFREGEAEFLLNLMEEVKKVT